MRLEILSGEHPRRWAFEDLCADRQHARREDIKDHAHEVAAQDHPDRAQGVGPELVDERWGVVDAWSEIGVVGAKDRVERDGEDPVRGAGAGAEVQIAALWAIAQVKTANEESS